MNSSLSEIRQRWTQRPETLVLLMIVLLIVAVFWSWGRYRRTGEAAGVATGEAVAVKRMCDEMSALQNRPRVASLEVDSPDQIADRVRQAIVEAEIESRRLVSIDPQLPSRLPRSDYQIRATSIVLNGLTLPQTAAFMKAMTDSSQGMVFRDINLEAAGVGMSGNFTGDLSAEEAWNVRLILTQMIFSPISES